MPKIYILRHGPTRWNEMKLIQGRSDIPLSDDGRQVVLSWKLPMEMKRLRAFSSPLKRAVETAEILGFRPIIEPILIEMDFGIYEGESLEYLRMHYGTEFLENEMRGVHFLPPRGESPKMVQERLGQFLNLHKLDQEDMVVFAHKSVIRSLYSLATGWDMVGEAPHRIEDNAVHVFELKRDGNIDVQEMNIQI